MLKIDRKRFFTEYRNNWGVMSQSMVNGLESLLLNIESDDTIKDKRWASYILATVKHECSDTWQPIIERGGRDYFDRYEKGTVIGRRLGNTEKGDGYKYRGRGYCQITGRANYHNMALILGIDMINRPETALDPDVAYKIMSYGMRNGTFTGKKLGDYINKKTCDYVGARKIINGTDCDRKIANYAERFEEILK